MNKKCAVCNNTFEARYKRQTICSPECRVTRHRETCKNTMKTMRLRKKAEKSFPSFFENGCKICKFKPVVVYSDPDGKIHALCPNHKALIEKSGKTLEELTP